MFLYPALAVGFLFVGVPLLVHLINMLRHRRQVWAAMDFLLASYRKQKKWIRLRQILLLLSRLAFAALLVTLLSGWTGGGKLLGVLGGRTTHHVIVLDDSASMGDRSVASDGTTEPTAYARALRAIADLIRRLASEDGNHQLTVMRASRAALVVRGGSESGDAAADLSAQTITGDARLINRLMTSEASPIRTDLVPALDLAGALLTATTADEQYLYIASDFRSRDWSTPERLAESLRKVNAQTVQIRMIDCATTPASNLAITDLTPTPDVWVAGVPVVMSVTVKNYSELPAKNVSISVRVIRYGRTPMVVDPTREVSGDIEPLPTLLIESLGPGEEVTKTFQVFVTEKGTHAVEVSLPEDALPIDNLRTCTLPLSDVEKVLIIDADPNARGAFHIASVLNPGSQVRIGAIPDIKPPTFLRGVTAESLSAYRAIYLIDLPQISENAADAIIEYVQQGGGLANFMGSLVDRGSYNESLLTGDRRLLPASLGPVEELPNPTTSAPDIVFGEPSPLMKPIRPSGERVFSLVGLTKSWTLLESPSDSDTSTIIAHSIPRVTHVLQRRDGKPLVTYHELGRGRVITVLTGLDGSWTNWPGDPTFVVFILQTNATLWSGAAPTTQRSIDSSIVRRLPGNEYLAEAVYVPASDPPRIPLTLVGTTESNATGESVPSVRLEPMEQAIAGEANVDDLIKPGISEWGLTRADGQTEVVPVASVIQVGEGELNRQSAAEIQQALLPLEVQFLSSTAWSDTNQAAGSSTLTMVLLGLLGLVLATEQFLAYWASYHTPAKAASPVGTNLGFATRGSR